MDWETFPGMCVPMTDEVNEDMLELCRALSTRAGMLLEDCSAAMILVGHLQQSELRAAISEARIKAGRAGLLLAAAEAMLAPHPSPGSAPAGPLTPG